MDRVEIYSSKKKSILLLISSIAFVALGLWLFLAEKKLVGIGSILFFGLGIFVAIKRLIQSEIALIITTEGLNINPKNSLTEFIKWRDVKGFEEITIQRTRIVIIGVKNPEYWLEKETSKFRKRLMQFNITNYNSPFNIAAAGLDISSNELNETLNKYFNKYKNKV